MNFNEKCKILSHEDSAPGYRTLVFSAPQIAAAVVPGQFVHVKVPRLDDAALRRPFSVFDADAEAGTLTVLYKIVGKGTEALAKESVGSEVEVIGPLGFGFPVQCNGVPLLVGGGYGVAPLYFLAKRMLKKGVTDKIARETDKACGSTCCVLWNKVKRLNADKSYRTVDAESDKDEGNIYPNLCIDTCCSCECRNLPVHKTSDKNKSHKDDVWRSTSSFEELSRNPSAYDCSDSSDIIMD